MHKIIDIFYNLLLGLTLGSSFALAAFVAPAIFNSSLALGGEILSPFQEGLIMTAIFKKYSTLLIITAIVILIKEVTELAVYRNRDYFQLGIALVAVVSTLLFAAYFTPEIIEAQAGGPELTGSKTFQAIHQASVLDFSFILVSLAVLMAKVSAGIKAKPY